MKPGGNDAFKRIWSNDAEEGRTALDTTPTGCSQTDGEAAEDKTCESAHTQRVSEESGPVVHREEWDIPEERNTRQRPFL